MGAFTMRILRLLPFVLRGGGAPRWHSRPPSVWEAPRAKRKSVPGIFPSVPSGEELPPGSGTSQEGALVYQRQGCAGCHGARATGTDEAPTLLKAEGGPDVDPWDLGRVLPIRAPYATTVWDYINRGMPLFREGTLTADEVYALTAFLLNINGVIPEDAVMDDQSLPRVNMPNREAWAPLPDWKPGMQRLEGYPY